MERPGAKVPVTFQDLTGVGVSVMVKFTFTAVPTLTAKVPSGLPTGVITKVVAPAIVSIAPSAATLAMPHLRTWPGEEATSC